MNSQKPLISTIIPYYNQDPSLFKEAIESLLAQSFKNWEAIVVNDGSSIENKNFLKDFLKSLNDNRFTLLDLNKNSGPAVARNLAIKHAKGEIITFLDTDDLLLPWFYEKVIENFQKNSECLILSGTYLYYTYFRKFKNICLLEDKSINETPILQQLICKKEVFKKISFDSALYVGEDDDLRFQVLDNESLFSKTRTIPETGYIYRIHPSPNRLSYRYDLRFDAIEKIKNKYKGNYSLAYKTIKNWEKNRDHWRLNKFLGNYLKNGSIVEYLKNTFSIPGSVKDKVRNLRALLYTSITCKFLVPYFAVDLRYPLFISGKKGNKYRTFKKMYEDYLTVHKENSYALKTFQRIF